MIDLPADSSRFELRGGAWYHWTPSWLSGDAATELMDALQAEITWEERHIIALGKEVLQPRLVGWAGALAYHYSGQTLEPRAMGPALTELTAAVREATGESFNHVVLNLYRDGRDHVSMHADNEPELGWTPTIASVSLGATRTFIIKAKGRRYYKRLRLVHGSLLVMGGTFQRKYRHQVPREDHLVAPRLNITLRTLMGPPGWREPLPAQRR